eukprot:2642718-Rhodomonas_salina.1
MRAFWLEIDGSRGDGSGFKLSRKTRGPGQTCSWKRMERPSSAASDVCRAAFSLSTSIRCSRSMRSKSSSLSSTHVSNLDGSGRGKQA